MIVTRMTRLSSSLACVAALGALGCGAEFDDVSELVSLRVLGVEKSAPYAQPGETVRFELAFYDGAPDAVFAGDDLPEGEAKRKVQVAWLGGCFNPAGDLYAGCFATPAENFTFSRGTSFDLELPADVMIPRPPPLLPYGLSYVFFAVCAGELTLDTSGAEGLPIRCRDAAGRDLGANDFVVGYTAVYVFGTDANGYPYENMPPIVNGFALQGNELPLTSGDAGSLVCLGADCLADCSDELYGCVNRRPPEIDCNVEGAPCIAACPDDGDPEKCPAIPIRPLVDQSMPAEIDAISRDVYQRPYQEQMWINYYATRGAVRSDARLLNDATAGWNADYGTDFYAPSTPGPVQIFAVAHDNRGAATWVGATIQVE
jgi:hypothetical protein